MNNEIRGFPQSVEAERALLGGLMLSPTQIEDIAGILVAADFYRPDHRAIYDLMLKMRAAGDEINMITVPDHVGRGGKDELYGGLAYVLNMPEACPSTTNLAHYAEIVQAKSRLRRVIEVSHRVAQLAYAHEADAEELVTLFDAETAGVSGGGRDNWISYAEAQDEAVIAAHNAAEGNATEFIPTHIPELNDLLGGGLPVGEPTLIAARPSMGKSSLARGIMQHAAALGYSVACFLLETTPRQAGMLALADETGVSTAKIRRGDMTEEEWDRLHSDLDTRNLPIYISRLSGVTAAKVLSETRSLNAKLAKEGKPPVGLIVIDYIQLMMRSPGSEKKNTNDAVAEMSRDLKIAGSTLRVAMLELSQLNRSLESRADKRPIMSDLRDSGALEQDARVILFPFRESQYDESADPTKGEIGVAKNTYGGIGTVPCKWNGPRSRFEPAAGILNLGVEEKYPDDPAPPKTTGGDPWSRFTTRS
jgi:replicative DNA helicase